MSVNAIPAHDGCDGANPASLPRRGEAMQDFVARQNIVLFKRLLASALDPAERERLVQLLAEEKAKLAGLDPAKR